MEIFVAKIKKEPAEGPTTKECPQCLSQIPILATRCAYCTQALNPN
jgi:large conductance mechanosensitive channel